MGAGVMAPRPGSTFQPQGGVPPQGGKGGGGRPMQPQMPAQGGKGVVQPGQPQLQRVPFELTPEGTKQAQIMNQGKGAGTIQPPSPGMPLTPNPSSPYYFPNGPEPSAQALNQGKGQGVPMGGMLGGGGNPMQPQVPAQGGKAPLTQEQIAALAPNIDPIRPMPQVSPPQGIRFPSDFTPPAPGQTYINPNINPAGFTGTLPPRLQQPAPVMPRPMPQVMPRQPTPKPAPVMPRPAPQVMPRGLAGLRGRR